MKDIKNSSSSDAVKLLERACCKKDRLGTASAFGIAVLSFGLSALPGNVQAQQYTADMGQSITIPAGTTASSATTASILAQNGGLISGTSIRVSSTFVSPSVGAVQASGVGSQVALDGNTVINAIGRGIQMDNGGVVNLGDDSVINLTGIANSGAASTYDGVAGILNTGTAAATMGSGIVITISGNRSGGVTDISAWIGAVVKGSGNSLSFYRLTVQGDSANVGIYASDGASVTLANSSLTINGDTPGPALYQWPDMAEFTNTKSSGVTLRGASGEVSDTNIVVNSQGGLGVLLSSGMGRNTLNMTRSTILTTGQPVVGALPVAALFNDADVTLSDVSITALGDGYIGARLNFATRVTGSEVLVTTTGADAIGVRIFGNSTMSLTNSFIDATGSRSLGLEAFADTNTVFMSGGHIQSTASAIQVTAAAPNNFLSFSDGIQLASSGSTVFDIRGANTTLNLSNGATARPGNNLLLDVASGASAALTATNGVVLSGDMQATDLNSVIASLSSNTVWTGAARNIGATSITDDSTWNMTGNSDVASLVLENSQVVYSAPAGDPAVLSNYKTLTVRADYTGNGGLVVLNTWLASDNSPTDLLVVQGNTAGSSLIAVRPSGGGGALTTGNGIMLVNVQGDSAGQFALSNRVAAGAYEYLLFKGGVDADAENGNWYLRNTYTPTPTPDDPNPEPEPIVRPEVPTSMVIPPLAIEYGYSMLGTMQDRGGEVWTNAASGNGYGNVGPVYEERSVWCKGKNPNDPNVVVDPNNRYKCIVRVPVAKANGADNDATHWARSGWARAIGTRGFQEPGNFLRRGPDYNYTFWGVQAGLDVFAREQADGTLDRAGVYVGYGQIASDVKGQFGAKAGTVDMDAYTVGGYWTHYSAQGWYTDAVVQGTWYAADAKSNYGQRIKPDGFGILGSLEAGYAFKLGSGWTVEPQAQIVYQNVSFDDARDSFGFVRFDDGDSLRGRIGARLTKTWNTAEGSAQPRLITAFLRGNVWHEFLGKTTTRWGALDGYGLSPFSSYLGGTWGEIGAGVTAQMTEKVNLFATGSYNHSLDGKGREGWDGRLGVTAKW